MRVLRNDVSGVFECKFPKNRVTFRLPRIPPIRDWSTSMNITLSNRGNLCYDAFNYWLKCIDLLHTYVVSEISKSLIRSEIVVMNDIFFSSYSATFIDELGITILLNVNASCRSVFDMASCCQCPDIDTKPLYAQWIR